MPSNLEAHVSKPIFVVIFCAMNDSMKRLTSVGLAQARPNNICSAWFLLYNANCLQWKTFTVATS